MINDSQVGSSISDEADLQEFSHIAVSTAYQEQWNKTSVAALWLKAVFML